MGACLDECHTSREKFDFEMSGHDDYCHTGYLTMNTLSVDSLPDVFNVQGLGIRVSD